MEVLKSAVQEIMKETYKEGMTFKITGKRSDHTFELDSRELNQTLGSAVFKAIPNVKAQMKNPDINLQVEIREEAAIFPMKPFVEQEDYLWEVLVKACSCCREGLIHLWQVI